MTFVTDFSADARSSTRGAAIGFLAAAFSGLAAQAETAPAPPATPPAMEAGNSANGRFAMTPVAGGFLRLDTRTGQVSLCTLGDGQPQCRAGADERAALEAEIDRLARENAALKAQGFKEPPKEAQDDEDRRFDRALDRAERFMRRMMQIFRDSDGKPTQAPL